MTDSAVRPLTDETKKLIKDAQDYTSSSLYSQTRCYKQSHIFGYKQAYINFFRIGRPLCSAKRQLENSSFSAFFVISRTAARVSFFFSEITIKRGVRTDFWWPLTPISGSLSQFNTKKKKKKKKDNHNFLRNFLFFRT